MYSRTVTAILLADLWVVYCQEMIILAGGTTYTTRRYVISTHDTLVAARASGSADRDYYRIP